MKYEPSAWNGLKTYNCFAYGFNIKPKRGKPRFKSKPQPAIATMGPLTDSEIRDCDRMYERVKADNPSLLRWTFSKPCPRGYRKIFMAVDDSDDADYHFYREDDNGYWSHKPGATNARDTNYDGKKIVAPHLSNLRSDSHNYNKMCGYYCYNKRYTSISDTFKGGKRIKPVKKR